jgi:cytochrome c oxidase subunit III
MLILGMVGSALLFLFVLLIYLLRKGSGDVSLFIPKVFWFSTVVILLSSFMLQFANRAFVEERFRTYRLCLFLTLFLGIVFIILQFIGWQEMLSKGIHFDTNNMGGVFIYTLSGLHIFHTLGGIIFLLLVNRDALRNLKYVDSYVYSVNPPNQLKIKLISIYWHFVDCLWVLLFLFLLYHAT